MAVLFLLFTVQSHKVCRESAGDDQLSHGTLTKTGCMFFFFPQVTIKSRLFKKKNPCAEKEKQKMSSEHVLKA